jgi:hypothetical protein
MKNANCGPALLSVGIEAREWNGCAIQRRQADGFVNATAMCRAGGKRWNDYARVDRSREYICALATSIGAQIPCAAAVAGFPASGIHGLIHVIKGGSPELQGTWIHPRLAVDLARWISPSFAVWMDGWFLEAMGVAIPAPVPQPPAPRRAPAPRGPHQDPLQLAASMLPALIAQRWIGDPEANDLIRGIAQHLLLSCDPLPPMAAVEGAAVAWSRQQNRRTGQYGAGTHW